ncbi:glycosyltransferase N-terminal domain-containing protein [Xinfangfangia sp. CPCC 101601]|uniref:3-deoxy-D-manno-octulosonic acid transferase n=1 Tax=Pseudogemmobacter lacusdianii TaxID=3069608 RepID=A0ABU0VVK3_9RHOB|nr:glycosyltransferase N-terminal domain-containing protein [Xinfangfangia sp. CPCC 101601]MDQ2065784.1 glycosyltransferase N-terminal domain-containing protein [Xinfangfangia sp. CPCC 101601]
MAAKGSGQLAFYLGLVRALPLIAPAVLRRRVKRGKEDPKRWREKLGEASVPRPEGRLIWLHAVGLGEVLALRGLIGALAAEAPDLSFLVTSTARSSGQVMGANLPPRTTHQFLPLDAPRYLRRFLAHWRPDLSIWAEQDLWPAAVVEADRAGIPLALVNARMNDRAFASRARAKSLYGNLFRRFRLIAAQDATTARNLTALGAKDPQVTGSLKAAAPALGVDPAALAAMTKALAGRPLWLLASSHPEDEAVALAAHRNHLKTQANALLVIVPRDPPRGPQIAETGGSLGLSTTLQSQTPKPSASTQVHIADAFGQLGLWYRLAPTALIGGSFSAIEGHNPWEAAALNTAILHGPHTANFSADYSSLDGAGAALAVSAESLPAALAADHSNMVAKARALSDAAKGSLAPLASDLLRLMK